MKCKICGSQAKYAYSIPTTRKEFADQYDFYVCPFCRFAFTTALDHVDMAKFYGDGYEQYDIASGRRGPREVGVAKRALEMYRSGGVRTLSLGDRTLTGQEYLSRAGFDVLSADLGLRGAGHWDLSNGLPRETFDIITLIEVAEHFVQPLAEFTNISALLNPGGVLCGTTGCRDFAEICRDSKPDAEWWYCNTANCDNGHISLYSLSSLLYLARQCNLELFLEPRDPAVTDYMGQSQVVFYFRRPA